MPDGGEAGALTRHAAQAQAEADHAGLGRGRDARIVVRQPARRRLAAARAAVEDAAPRRHRRGQLRGHVRLRRRLEVRRRQDGLLRVPGTAGQRAQPAPRRAWTSSTRPTTTRSTSAHRGHAQTLAALSAAGVKATGAPGQIQILRSHGNTVAFVGFSTYPWAAPLTDDAAVAALIKQAAQQANIVVAFLHGGAEGAEPGAPPARPGDRVRREPRRPAPLRPHGGRRRRGPRARLRPARPARPRALPRAPDRLLARQPRRLPQLQQRRPERAERDPHRRPEPERALLRGADHLAHAGRRRRSAPRSEPPRGRADPQPDP